MKNLLICLALFASTQVFAQKERHKHHDRKEFAEKRATYTVENLNDYVTALPSVKRDSLVSYFTAYYGNAMTYSPTCKVRMKTRKVLDNKVKNTLTASQYKEYEVFMKDEKKRHHKGKHFKHHSFRSKDDNDKKD